MLQTLLVYRVLRAILQSATTTVDEMNKASPKHTSMCGSAHNLSFGHKGPKRLSARGGSCLEADLRQKCS
jgi:hypothetical protein